jgi:hypothetical protein
MMSRAWSDHSSACHTAKLVMDGDKQIKTVFIEMPKEWGASYNGNILQIARGSAGNYPQYAALDCNSGYLRLVYGPQSTWGTSIIILPSFWATDSKEIYATDLADIKESLVYRQGGKVSHKIRTEGSDLLVDYTSQLSGLNVTGTVRFSPPRGRTFSATVDCMITGPLSLANRPGEAFKPVFLSSMRVSSSQWDSQKAYVDGRLYALPQEGWIINPPLLGRVLGLQGGTSKWKTNSPTIEISFVDPMPVTGWVTQSNDLNDDSVGFWVGLNQVLNSWHYTITAKP